MPPRRLPSPLALETCSSLASDAGDYDLACSDDELDERQRSARRGKIEKLGEAYLQGKPLFILSAGLRGPLDKGWNNPWRKDRKKSAASQIGGADADPPVIPETNSRKRKLYQSPITSTHARSSATLSASSRPGRIRETALATKSRDRVPDLGAEVHCSPHFTRVKPSDSKWLKKDKVSTRFQNIDSPTSPTTSVSARRVKPRYATQSLGRSETAAYEKARSSKGSRPKYIPSESSIVTQPGLCGTSPNEKEQSGGPRKRKGSTQSNIEDVSLRVVSSSSQLPKFEYRLKPHSRTDQISSKSSKDGTSESSAAVLDKLQPDIPKSSPAKLPSMRSTEKTMDQHDTEVSKTVTNATYTDEDPRSSHLEKGLAGELKSGTTSENNLPSAQPAPENPPIPDNLASLYSIAISKGTSTRTEDHNNDHQFSTQAAVLMAQKSFQNDLRSPEQSPVLSKRKRRVSQGSNNESPNQINITPFHRLNTPDQDIGNPRSAPRTGASQMMSTQYMIDAATPFTFSTEKKKTDHRLLSSGKDRSASKKRKTPSFAISPSVSSAEQSDHDEEHIASVFEPLPHDAPDSPFRSQHSALPMTLTGTTPPTAQEGQGADSFNLSQAIAEAGSWLQQSFEINKDIAHCKTAKPPQTHPPNILH
ncbi:hypothetical protein BJX68DRAFT_239649 [Aspergillus pseudodeflectus]|uniref:Protamine P1 n=1 Tax=Aspergillus pseudodeflectus TaxID=176178 RepID=A0ABR4K6I3_9EURO